MELDGVVLCRPQGGLNDILCRIGVVCWYATRFRRKVIVDTNHRSTIYMRDDFSRYFLSRQDSLALDLTATRAALDRFDGEVVPSFLKHRLLDYDVRFDPERRSVVESTIGEPITFDFEKAYKEPLLVHHMSGNAPGAAQMALARLRLRPELRDELTRRLRLIGPGYAAVHIRNTDLRTDYRILLARLKASGALNGFDALFVATDDAACYEFCQDLFAGLKVVGFSQLPVASTRPLHHLSEVDDVYVRNRDAILDLLMLALSDRYFPLELSKNRWGARYSGFSILAKKLRKSPAVFDGLLN